MSTFSVGDWIYIRDMRGWLSSHTSNHAITNKFRGLPVKILDIRPTGEIKSVQLQNPSEKYDCIISFKESELYFSKCRKDGSSLDTASTENSEVNVKVVYTYIEDTQTFSEEDIFWLDVSSTSVKYKFSRKKLGFIKYSGEGEISFAELKQITIESTDNVNVLHIENGVVVREHVLYNNEKKFNGFTIGVE